MVRSGSSSEDGWEYPGGGCSRRAARDVLARRLNTCLVGAGEARWARRPYTPTTQDGIVKMGKAENRLCEDVVADRLHRAESRGSAAVTRYPNFRGDLSLRESVVRLLQRKVSARSDLDPDSIFIVNGTMSAIQQFAYAVADEGEGIMVPAPYYNGLNEHLRYRVNATIVPVYMDMERTCARDGLGLDLASLDAAYQRATQQGVRVVALFLINPHNPSGVVMSRQNMADCLEFAHRRRLHVCFDEIYALSAYEHRRSAVQPFVSALSLTGADLPDPDRTHTIYGLSKDFALPSCRVGIFHTSNPGVRAALGVACLYHNVPVSVQEQVARVISDDDWVDSYIAQNQQQIRAARRLLADALDVLQVPYTDGCAGFFLWLDLSQLLYERSYCAEHLLYLHFLNSGVLVESGEGYCPCGPGYIRVVFTAEPLNLLPTGVSRICEVIREVRRDPRVITQWRTQLAAITLNNS